jgi:hypothetical protein
MMRQARRLPTTLEVAASPDMSTTDSNHDTPPPYLATAMQSVEADWRLMVETAVIGMGRWSSARSLSGRRSPTV